MFANIIIVIVVVAAIAGGLIALFAGRRFYALWLGLAVFFFTSRILDLALFRTPEAVRSLGGLAIALLIVAVVVLLRDRVVRFIPPIGGFIVSAIIAERLLGILFPEAGKFFFFAVLIGGGLLGFFLFIKLLDFDDAIIVLSAVWGASFLSTAVFDLLDIFLISAAGALKGSYSGYLDTTQLLQTLVWLGLAALGILVQRRLSFQPIPVIEKKKGSGPVSELSSPTRPSRRGWIIGGLVGGLLFVFLLAVVGAGNNTLAKSIRSSLTHLERSLGLEAEAPGDASWEWASTLLRPQIELKPDDRILVLVPHPDDDILSNAGLIQQALDKNIPVKVVLFTNGDYNETSFALFRKEINLSVTEALRLGETRHEEALAAQENLGVKPEQITFLGYPDGGTLEIFEKHWGDTQPYRALLSGQSGVFYTFAQSLGAPFKGESILADLEQVVRDFKPTKIFTSHPGDVHPDHQSLPLYLQVALWDLKDEIQPEVYHFITHYGRWPQPRGYQPERPLDPPAQYDIGNRWRILPVTEEQRQKKLQALQAHKTQWGSGKPYLESVVRANELWDVIDEIPIAPGEEVQILPAQAAFSGEALSLLPESEQEKFTETEMRSVKLDGDELVFSIESQQPLAGDVRARVWTIGYRSDKPFGEMPKIYMDLGASGFRVYNQGFLLPDNSVTVSGTPTRSEVRIPLALLGDPERVLVSAQTSIDDVPLDNIPWIFIKINKEYEQEDNSLGESLLAPQAQTMTNANQTNPKDIADLEASYGAPSQAGFGSAVFYEQQVTADDLEKVALEKYRYFVGDLWERYGEDAWMGSWKEVYARPADAEHNIVAELRGIQDPDAAISVPMILDNIEGAEQARAALASVFDDPKTTDLQVFNLGDGAALAGLLIAGLQGETGDAIFLVFLFD